MQTNVKIINMIIQVGAVFVANENILTYCIRTLKIDVILQTLKRLQTICLSWNIFDCVLESASLILSSQVIIENEFSPKSLGETHYYKSTN